ncbi:MAG: hypothetical protein M1827_004670 [Pycnora praestabilis]|nr:MAG: hypothetical protein M1827_004670 [Pycnora praestabilis]
MSELKEFSSLFRLDGKVALVTGGSRGLGFHTATALLSAGTKKVILTSRKVEGTQGLSQAVQRLNGIPNIKGRAISITADLSKTFEIERLVAEIRKTDDRIDILVANAGATWGGPFEPTPDSSSIKVLDLNVRSVFNMIRLMTPLLERAGTRQDPSRVIIVGSTAGFSVPHVGDHGTIMYSASKAAAHHLTKNLAVELGPRNITTNTVAPGFFPSKLANGLIEILGGRQELEERNPRKRLGEPVDIAGAMIYLCSPAGAYVNGVTITLDGGDHLSAGRFSRI